MVKLSAVVFGNIVRVWHCTADQCFFQSKLSHQKM